MGLETAFLIASIASAGAGIASSVSASKQRKKAASAAQSVSTPASPQVGDKPAGSSGGSSAKEESAAKRIGRQALIATSPQGVQTTAPTGRRKLLGN